MYGVSDDDVKYWCREQVMNGIL